MAEFESTCGACGQTDDHPKHQIAVGADRERRTFHEHDFGRNGCIHYHFDCPSEWHDAVTNPDPHEDGTVNDTRQLAADTHRAIIEKAQSGVHGDDLRAFINTLNVRGGAGGIDQTMATGILAALSPNSGTKTIGAITITGPIKMRLMTANGSDTAAGTELSTSGGYTAGGSALSMATAASGAVSTNSAVSWTNMPSTTLTGMEQWDSSGTPLRSFWGPWSGGNISVASGNTFTVASGNLTDSLA
jgi:hypothetical protein